MARNFIRAVIFDDLAQEGEHYARALTNDRLHVEHLHPRPNLDFGGMPRGRIDLFLVDYDLTGKDGDTEPVNYLGGPLATAIRQHYRDTAIVLLTRRGLLRDTYHDDRFVEASTDIDDVFYKEDLDASLDTCRDQIIAIAEGFRALSRRKEKNWQSLLNALGGEDQEHLLIEAAPPQRDWQVFESARWIRRVLQRYPGLLYNSLHAATLLGIDKSAFLNSEVQGLFKKARYTGVFDLPEGQWWRSRVLALAHDFVRKRSIRGPINRTFAEAYLKHYKEELSLSKCVYSGDAPADWVCYVLEEPVKIDYSLRYFPDGRPSIMDEARVSFKAIRESNKVRDEWFDSESSQSLKDVREKKA